MFDAHGEIDDVVDEVVGQEYLGGPITKLAVEVVQNEVFVVEAVELDRTLLLKLNQGTNED